MKDLFSKYSIEARVYPTVVGLIPFFVLQYFFFPGVIPTDLLVLKIVGNVTLSMVVLYLVTEFFVRYPSKLLEDKLFDNKRNFPTTRFLLFSDQEYSVSFKENFRIQVKQEFSHDLLGQREESEDETEARKRIKEAIGMVIKVVGSGDLVLKHNISYGFFRNLWGSSWLGLFASVILAGMGYIAHSNIVWLGVVFVFSYGLYLIFGKHAIEYFGEVYARKLIEEYCSNRNNYGK